MKCIVLVGLAAFGIAAAGIAHAQTAPVAGAAKTDHSGHVAGSGAAPAAGAAPSTAAFQAASDRMHKDMGIAYSGNADVDFVKGMIPHHQGAVDMAKVVLAHGKDPEVRKLAQGVVKAQEAEIAWMRKWLEKNKK